MQSPALIPEEFVESCNPDGVCVGCSRLGEYCAVRGAAIGCADLVARDGFDLTDRPSAGVGCAACARAGHWCPAKGMSSGTALCLACGTGEICDQAKSVEKMRSGGDDFELERGYAIAECRTIAIADADRVVTEVAPMSAWAIKASLDPENLKKGLTRGQRAPIGPRTYRERRKAKGKVVKERKPKRVAAVKKAKPEEVVMEKMELEEAKAQALRMASAGSRINPIAKVTGWNWAEVKKWLVEAGAMPAKGGAKAKRVVAAKKEPLPPSAERPASVGVQLTERNLDAFWAKCSLAEKARAFSAMFEAR